MIARRSIWRHRTAWGRRLLHATGVLLTFSAQAQTWERLPFVPLETDAQSVYALGFIKGEGPQSDDPLADSLIIGTSGRGLFLYNPSGAAGAAGDNGFWHPWHLLCRNASCAPQDLVVTATNTLLFGSPSRTLSRSTDRGRTWNHNVDGIYAIPFHESALPGLAGPAGERGLVVVVSGDGNTRISRTDGVPGTWQPAGNGLGPAEVFGEVPSSAALPSGRLLLGVLNGVSGSTDGGASYQPTSLYTFGGYIGYSFAFVPQEGHPYGGVAFAGVDNTSRGFAPHTEVHRSDDGGQTWTLAHRFTPEGTGLPAIMHEDGYPIYPFDRLVLAASPDGALWAAVHYNQGSQAPGVILRSDDLGATWIRADDGFEGYVQPWQPAYYPASTPEQPFGWRVRRFALARTGVLYAATDRGVWRTTQPVVAREDAPPASSDLSLSVSPNPSSSAVTFTLSAREAQRARVVVSDVTGREVAAVEAWATPAGSSVSVDASSWASGVYVARASVGRHTEHVTARFAVAR